MLTTVQEYIKEKLRQDLFAGLTVTFFALPQSMAYAMLAGIEPRYGLYAFIVGAIVGSLFGSSRHLQTGPTNASSIVLASTLAAYANHDNFMGLVFLVAMLAGVFQLTAGLLRLGNLTQFISGSVLVGFIAAAGLLIAVNQLPNLLGLPVNGGVSVMTSLHNTFSRLHQIQFEPLALGLGTVVITLVLNKISPRTSTGMPALPSYLIAILLAAGAVWFLDLMKKESVRLVKFHDRYLR